MYRVFFQLSELLIEKNNGLSTIITDFSFLHIQELMLNSHWKKIVWAVAIRRHLHTVSFRLPVTFFLGVMVYIRAFYTTVYMCWRLSWRVLVMVNRMPWYWTWHREKCDRKSGLHIVQMTSSWNYSDWNEQCFDIPAATDRK